jgi:hypothetical protein
MTLRERMTVVSIERVDRRRTCERGAGEACAPAVEEDSRIAVGSADLRCRIRSRNRRRRRSAGGGSDTGQIDEAALRLSDGIGWQIAKGQAANEIADVAGHFRLAGGTAR